MELTIGMTLAPQKDINRIVNIHINKKFLNDILCFGGHLAFLDLKMYVHHLKNALDLGFKI